MPDRSSPVKETAATEMSDPISSGEGAHRSNDISSLASRPRTPTAPAREISQAGQAEGALRLPVGADVEEHLRCGRRVMSVPPSLRPAGFLVCTGRGPRERNIFSPQTGTVHGCTQARARVQRPVGRLSLACVSHTSWGEAPGAACARRSQHIATALDLFVFMNKYTKLSKQIILFAMSNTYHVG